MSRSHIGNILKSQLSTQFNIHNNYGADVSEYLPIGTEQVEKNKGAPLPQNCTFSPAQNTRGSSQNMEGSFQNWEYMWILLEYIEFFQDI